ncbi:MAG: excinuclease ABC subunit UvrC [Pseudomonadota bacterium]
MPDPFDAKTFLKNLSTRPGVYQMLDEKGTVLYVGKARSLKSRVSSYFQSGADLIPKTRALMKNVADVSVTITGTETEALILEYNLIKRYQPRYNVVLRDDKSYPYVRITEHEYPRITFYRGSRKQPGRFFGPYPSAKSVREGINLLQKLFRIRGCEDSFFSNRSRPCLQHQIKRCSAPCVSLISEANYGQDLEHAVKFLEGRNDEVIEDLGARMDEASQDLDFESAAQYRDQIATLKKAQEKQFVSRDRRLDVDVVFHEYSGRLHCLATLFIRKGRNLGVRTYFPKANKHEEPQSVLSSFVTQYYLSHEVPKEIVLSGDIEDQPLLEEVLAERAERRVSIKTKVRGDRAHWLEMTQKNAKEALALRLATDNSLQKRYESLRQVLNLGDTPERLECFDISHSQGESTVASCVVFGSEGPRKTDYRRFNIRDIEPGDDYAAMNQALERRYKRLKKGEAPLPDVLFVDGGKGQVTQAVEVFENLQINGVMIVGIAKGPGRKPGYEQLFLPGEKRPLILPADSAALHLIQQIRDEAHRFAITGHRGQRAKTRKTSRLEDIPGLGPKKRRDLLRQFGGLQGVTKAGVDDLLQVPGISRRLAELIYDRFHGV